MLPETSIDREKKTTNSPKGNINKRMKHKIKRAIQSYESLLIYHSQITGLRKRIQNNF